METTTLSINDPQAMARGVEILRQDGLIAIPTDTVYGVAALVHSAAGIERLYQAKERSATKAIAVLIGAVEQLYELTPGLTDSAAKLAARFWPGALTLVVPRSPALPTNLSTLPTVGVRMPNHAFVLKLMQQVGPLATTSANLSGDANTLTAEEVLAQLCGRIGLILDGGRVPGGVPSTVVDCTQDPPKILRQGAISADEIGAALD